MILKTEAHTLMTARIDIMTISFKKEVFEDVFSDSDWPIFDGGGLESVPDVSLIDFVCKSTRPFEPIDNLDESCAKKVIECIYKNSLLSNYDSYLFVSHSAWIDDNRVSNHKKLWRTIPKEWGISVFSLGAEIGIKSHDGIRFAGLIKINNDNYLQAIKILRISEACVVILTEDAQFESKGRIRKLFQSAFNNGKDSTINWSRLSREQCKAGDILLRLSGSQDELESSIELIMIKEKLNLFGP